MGESHRADDVLEQVQSQLSTGLVVLEPHGQIDASHDHSGPEAGVPHDRVDLDDVLVSQGVLDSRLSLEARCIPLEWLQELDGAKAPQAEVLDKIDLTHPAQAQQLEDFVVLSDGVAGTGPLHRYQRSSTTAPVPSRRAPPPATAAPIPSRRFALWRRRRCQPCPG